ncbi:MAG: hypothetical protein ACKPKO_39750, partial [Candidatus Fonsibacter sp.]
MSITFCGMAEEGFGFSTEVVDKANVGGLPLPPSSMAFADGLDEIVCKQLALVKRLPEWRCPCRGAQGAKQFVVDCTTSP